jgi:hypothetical protein
MLSLLFILFAFIALAVILALSVVGAIIFRKKSTHTNPRINTDNVIDVTAKKE